MNRLSSLFIVLACAILISSAGGCSIGSVLGQPAFVDFKEFDVGVPRTRVTEVIGLPKVTTQLPPDNRLLDYHEFRSGTPGATRWRVVGYVLGDLLTLGLAELVFWPMELTIAKTRDFKGHIEYDTQQRIRGYRIVYDDGIVAKENMPPNSPPHASPPPTPPPAPEKRKKEDRRKPADIAPGQSIGFWGSGWR